MTSLLHRHSFWLVVLGLALCTVGSKWETIRQFGHDVPVMDEWDGLGQAVLQAWRQGTLDTREVFLQPHNEHRIGWTRLWALATTALNGQWDPLFDTTLNAVLHAAFIAGLLILLRRRLEGPAWWLVPAGLAATACVPLVWENTLHPFQIQYLFLIAAGIAHVAFVVPSPVATGRWWGGLAAGAFGLASMGSGFVAPAVAAGVRALRAWQARRWTRDDTITVAACAVLAIIGVAGISSVPHHAPLHADGLGGFLSAAVRVAAFPAQEFWPLVFILQAPLGWWLVRRAVRFRQPWTATEWAFVAGVAWLVAQCAALVYARASVNHAISSRYFEIYGLLLVANPVALGLLWRDASPRARRGLAILAWVWIAVAFWGGARLMRAHFHAYLAPAPATAADWSAHLREYSMTRDATRFEAVPTRDLPHPSHGSMRGVLDDPAMARILPTSIRPPVAFVPGRQTGFAEAMRPGLAPLAAGSAAWHADGSAPAHWESRYIDARTLLPVLRIQFAGSPELPTDSLRLETDDGRSLPLAIRRFGGGNWQSAHLFVPSDARRVRLVAEAGPDGRWLAFSNPVEVAFGSWLAHQARKRATLLIWLGAALAAVGLAFGAPRPPPSTTEPPEPADNPGEASPTP